MIDPIKIIINGVNGQMGSAIKSHINSQQDLQLVSCLGRTDNLRQTIADTKANVVIDFTTPQAVFENAQIIISAGAHPVIGTTGLSLDQVHALEKQCNAKKLGGIIAPNFSLGAILMMKYAQDAAKYFSDAEIVEMHHAKKLDAPSGTAKKTALMMTNARQTAVKSTPEIKIHSVRLPGLFAHQAVLFGAPGEILTIRHDSMDRSAYMPGIFLACRKVMTLDHLVYGLETLLGTDT